MTETKTEDQIEREKLAVVAMNNAKANMTTTLARITTLERALEAAKGAISNLKRQVGPESKMTFHADRGEVTDYVTKYCDYHLSKIVVVLP